MKRMHVVNPLSHALQFYHQRIVQNGPEAFNFGVFPGGMDTICEEDDNNVPVQVHPERCS